jgi:hypothetical protein
MVPSLNGLRGPHRANLPHAIHALRRADYRDLLGGIALPTELPVGKRPRPASDFELIALASLLPWCVSMLLVRQFPAIAQAFLLMGQIE